MAFNVFSTGRLTPLGVHITTTPTLLLDMATLISSAVRFKQNMPAFHLFPFLFLISTTIKSKINYLKNSILIKLYFKSNNYIYRC